MFGIFERWERKTSGEELESEVQLVRCCGGYREDHMKTCVITSSTPGARVRKTVQDVFDMSRRREAKAVRAQSVSPLKTLVCPSSAGLWTLSHHHSLSGALQKAGMLRGAGGGPERTPAAEMFTTQRRTDRLTTAETHSELKRQRLSQTKQEVMSSPEKTPGRISIWAACHFF